MTDSSTSLGSKSAAANRESECPGCGSRMRPFFEIPPIPANSCILMDSPEEARSYPRGDLVLGFCEDCGFIRNLAFDPALAQYSARYEETQGYSPTFRTFHEDQAAALIGRYGLKGKKVLEIGCGKGEFLALLCELGGNRGVGFDPGYDENRGVLDNLEDVRIVSDFYSDKYANETADFVCCKMTLEHIKDTADFVRLSRQAVRPDGSSAVYFQVPESMRILENCAFEDIYYEHCSYFTEGSLARLFKAQGFSVLRLQKEYGGQYLSIEATLEEGPSRDEPAYDDLDRVRREVATFPERCHAKIDDWRAKLSDAGRQGSVAVWGSGSKAVAFLAAVDLAASIERVVDINPHRQGHYMPGTGQPIVSPESLRQDPPGTVIVMNSIYIPEISAQLDQLGLAPTVIGL